MIDCGTEYGHLDGRSRLKTQHECRRETSPVLPSDFYETAAASHHPATSNDTRPPNRRHMCLAQRRTSAERPRTGEN